ITRIYEGTNGIQALDLVGRKLNLGGGRALRAYFALIQQWIGEHSDAPHAKTVGRALERLQQATLWIAAQGMQDAEQAAAAATPYLRLFALTSLAWMWSRMAAVASRQLAQGSSETAFYGAKLKTADFFMARLLPESESLLVEIQAGKASLMAFSDEEFAA